MSRPDMQSAMAAFLARGGKVTVTPPATDEVQREASIARRKADRRAEREAMEAEAARAAKR